jgi:putative ABC transport system permease protein
MFDTVLQDVRYALRGLARNPGFAITAILAAALGIGAATAVFSAVDRILFRALPYAHEDRLVSVGMMAPLDTTEFLLAEPYFQLRRDTGPFEAVTAFQAGAIPTDLTDGEPVRLAALRLEANFLDVLGVQPVAGRMFTRQEDVPNGPRVALISYRLWQERFTGDAGAVGRTIHLDGAPYQVIGILPKDFLMPTLADGDVIEPLALNEATERSGRALRAFARLKPGIAIPQAIAQMQPQFQRAMETVPPQFRKEVTMRIRSVRDRQLGDARLASIALFGSVLAVLLIACANIASLLLARGAAREQELAVRAALGASRARLARQSLTESLILSGLGGVLGCVFAWVLLRSFVAIAPAALPRLNEASIDPRVLLFTAAAALGSGLLFGIVPALRRPDFSRSNAARSVTRSHSGLRSALITAEIAFSMILLTGAGLLMRSLWNLEAVPLGMETSRIVTVRFTLGREHYGRAEQQLAFFNDLERRINAIPGVANAAITDTIPPSGGTRGRPFSTIAVEGRAPLPQGTGGMVSWRYITPGYFATLGIPIVRGRAFDDQDRDAGAFSAVLSETLARKLFPNENAIGKHILKGPQGQWTTVVGVARDVTNLGATRESWPEFYIVRKPVADYNFANAEPPAGWRGAVVIARTSVDARLAASSVRSILRSLDPALPVEVQTMQQRLEQIDQRPRFYAILLAAFSAIGSLIAAAGLFAVMSFLVAQRRREIGVRMALGATSRNIVAIILGSAARWTFAGVVIGGAGSLAAARLLRSLLFHVRPADPGAILAGVAILAAVAAVASAAPARRASRLDPVCTLREE